MTSQVFLDSSFVIAAISPRDQHHQRALALDEEVRSRRAKIVTTSGVLLEIGNSLAKLRTRGFASHAIQILLRDPTVEVAKLEPELFSRALELYQRRTDKEWGLVDCISFVVMWDRGLTEALTSDEHFEQAGFAALLRG